MTDPNPERDLLLAAITNEGRVEGDLLKVDGFLNHRVSPAIMNAVGAYFARILAPFDLVVTSEASGIAPGLATAIAGGTDLIYAKKRPAPSPGTALRRRISSPTKGDRPWLEIAPHLLDPSARVVVVDDFLSRGHTALALAEMLAEHGNEIGALGFVVEKAFTGGRSLLESHGFTVHAMATVTAFEDGRPVVA